MGILVDIPKLGWTTKDGNRASGFYDNSILSTSKIINYLTNL